MLSERFGAKSYGLAGWPEFGMWTVDGDALLEWAARWFTRGNAAGWVVGPEPLRVELPLPVGDRMPPPMPAGLPATFPAITRQAARIVGAAAVVPRSIVATLAHRVMTGKLQDVLRFEMGASYHVLPVSLSLTADVGWLSMTSDLSDSRMKETVQRFIAVLKDVATRGPVEEELDRHRSATVASLDAHGWEIGLADAMVFSELFGSVRAPRAKLRDAYLSISVDQVRALAGAVVSGALYQVPAGLDIELDGIKPRSRWSSWGAHEGMKFEREPRLAGPHEQFVLDEQGMTVWVGSGPLSVEWARVAAMLCWADGGRRVLGEDGMCINVVPTGVKRGRELVTAIDARVPPALCVLLGKRLCPPVPPPIRRDPAVQTRWSRQLLTMRSLGAALVALVCVVVMLSLPTIHDLQWGGAAAWIKLLSAVSLLALGGTVVFACAGIWGVARRAETSVGGGVGGVEVYDLAASHRQRLPAGVPADRSLVRGGQLLAFLALHELMSDWFVAEGRESVARLRRREITGPELYEEWGGVLASDMVSDVGNEFLFHMLRLQPKRGSRYSRLLGRVCGGPYGLPPTWDAYDRLSPLLQEELVCWRRRSRLYNLLRYVQAPPVF
jgi:hypothetical protein